MNLMTTDILTRLLLVLALTAPAAYVSAQASSIPGKIDSVMVDDGYIVIDGKQMPVRGGDLVITYKGEAVRTSFLAPGLNVLYSTRSDGSVSEITLLGPSNVLDQLDQH